MYLALPTFRRKTLWALFPLVLIGVFLSLPSTNTHAYLQSIQSTQANSTGNTTTGTFASGAGAGNVIIVVCASKTSSAVLATTSPSDYTPLIRQAGTPSQSIFYKVAAGGETSVTCQHSASGRAAIQMFEYRGLVTPVSGVVTSSGTSTTGSIQFGNVTTSTSQSLILAPYIINTSTNPSTWSNSYTELIAQLVGGNPTNRVGYGTATRVTTSSGTYTTTGSGANADDSRGQQAAFPIFPSVISAGFVDNNDVTVSSPSIAFTAGTTQFACQNSSATIGTSTQKMRIRNMTSNGNWSVSIAATGGVSAVWSNGSASYKYNSTNADSCVEGRLIITPSSATVTPGLGCTNSGVSLGSVISFTGTSSGTIASGSGTNVNCYWDITGIALSQTIPPEVPAGNYTLNMTVTGVSL